MSNDYYEHSDTFIPGDLARAEDVENEFKGVQSGFSKLPAPRSDGQGFTDPVFIGEATDPGHAATRGQLTALEQQAEQHKDAAALAQQGAETAQGLAEDAQTASESAQSLSETARDQAQTARGGAETAETNAEDAAVLASQWATQIASPVSGSDYGAKYYSNLSKDWASGSGEIEPGLKSAKGYAEEAQAIVAGARTYVGQHDASGGTYPIASPSSGDEGKYWIISEAGTLPIGTVEVGWELSINNSLAYEAANLLPANLVTEVNGKGGPSVVLNESDIPSIGSTYLAASQYTAADVLTKVKSVDGSGSGLDADTLDGQHGSYFLPAGNYTAADVLTKIKTVDGSGSGLNADLLDGYHASNFFPAGSVSSFGAALIDDATAGAARTTLGLGSAATQNTGTGAGSIPIRDGSGNVPGGITGNSATATKLANARTISLTGDATGSTTFDGSGNVAISTTVQNDSHAHTSVANYGNYTAPFNNASNTPRAFHNAGLCRAFVRSADGWPVSNGTLLNIPSYTASQDGGAMQILTPYESGGSSNNNIMWRVGLYNNAGWTAWKTGMDKAYADSLYLAVSGTAAQAAKLATARTLSITGDASGSTTFDGSANKSISLSLAASSVLSKIKTVDGAGSGLDADTLDGLQGSDYLARTDLDFSNADLVWSGSTNSGVPMTSLSSQGPGIYIVNSTYVIYVFDRGRNAYGAAQFTMTSDLLTIRSARYRGEGLGSSGFHLEQHAAYASGGTTANVIDEIHKV